LRQKRTRTRRPSLLALAALLLAAGCGGGDDNAPPPPRSAIDRAVAEQLAETSDSIADSLDGGDVCRAAGLADDLNSEVSAAIAAGKVPRRFQDDLQARATELVNTVNCARTAPTTTEQQDENGDETGDDKKQETEKKTEEETPTQPTVTVEVPTVTEEQP
jgi:hypothetical protein